MLQQGHKSGCHVLVISVSVRKKQPTNAQHITPRTAQPQENDSVVNNIRELAHCKVVVRVAPSLRTVLQVAVLALVTGLLQVTVS